MPGWPVTSESREEVCNPDDDKYKANRRDYRANHTKSIPHPAMPRVNLFLFHSSCSDMRSTLAECTATCAASTYNTHSTAESCPEKVKNCGHIQLGAPICEYRD